MIPLPVPVPIRLVLVMAAALSCRWPGVPRTAPPSSPETRAESGGALFRDYCASCHGSTGRGDGPVAPALVDVTPDLTRIAARRDGRFPAVEVAEYIDGWKRVVAHGTSDMPVWGRRLGPIGELGRDDTLLDPGRIFLLVEYLRSIQELD